MADINYYENYWRPARPQLSVVILALSLASALHAQQAPTDLVPVTASDIPRSVHDYRSLQNLSHWPPMPFNWLSQSNAQLYVSPSTGATTIWVNDLDVDYHAPAAQAQARRAGANDGPPQPPVYGNGSGGGTAEATRAAVRAGEDMLTGRTTVGWRRARWWAASSTPCCMRPPTME